MRKSGLLIALAALITAGCQKAEQAASPDVSQAQEVVTPPSNSPVASELRLPDAPSQQDSKSESKPEVQASSKPKSENSLPAFRGHEFGEPFVAGKGVRETEREGNKVVYVEDVQTENVVGFASYTVLDGVLESVSLSFNKPDMNEMIETYTLKLGRDPEVMQPSRIRHWSFDDGFIAINSNVVIITSRKALKEGAKEADQKRKNTANDL